jgi:hypothetical protein
MAMFFSKSDVARAWPWAEGLRTLLRGIGPCAFPGSHLMVGSDYSGDHESKDYRVYAFLAVDTDASPAWPTARKAVRDRFLADGRRLSFKKLSDKQRLAALKPFLQSTDLFTGMCIAFIVHKRFERLSTAGTTLSLWQRLHGVQGGWDADAFEAMVRVVHLFSLLVARWSRPNMHVSWVTDEDAIVANDARHTDLLDFAAAMAGVYVEHPLGELAVTTTAVDDSSRAFEDFVAVPDLVAGAMAELVSVWSRQPDWHRRPELVANGDLAQGQPHYSLVLAAGPDARAACNRHRHQ